MSALKLYDAFEDWNLNDEVGRFLWGIGKSREGKETRSNWLPAVDVSENNEAVQIHAELPGLKKEDVKINLRDGVLTIQGERKFEHEEKKKNNYYRVERQYGVFARSFSLPTTVDGEKIQASMTNGVLEILIPKKPEAKEKEIAISVK